MVTNYTTYLLDYKAGTHTPGKRWWNTFHFIGEHYNPYTNYSPEEVNGVLDRASVKMDVVNRAKELLEIENKLLNQY